MSQNRTIRAILALDYDKRALSGTQKAIDQLNTSLDATRKRALTVETAASGLKKELAELARGNAVEQIGRDFAKAGLEGRDFNDTVRETVARLQAIGASDIEIRRVASAYYEVAEAARTAATAEARAGSGRQKALGALGTFGREVKALPSVRLGPISTDQIGKILQTVDAGLIAVGASAATVAAASVIAAPALVALAIAVGQFFKGIEAGQKLVDDALKAQEAYYGAIADNTTQESIDQVEELQRRRAILQQQRNETQNAIDANGGPNNPATAQLVDRLKELDSQLSTSDQTVQRLTTGLQLNAFAYNDALEQQELLAKSIQRTLEAQMAAEDFARQNTVQASRERIETLRNEVEQLETANRAQQLYNTDAANAIIEHNNALIAEKNAAINATEAVLGLSSAFEASSFFKAVQEQGRGVFEGAINAVGNAFGGVLDGAIAQVIDTTQIQAKIEEAAAKTTQAIDAINAKLAEAEAKALTDRENGLRDAITKANDAREKQEIEHRDKLLAINAKANLAQNNAIGARDALAFYQAQQTRKSELSEEARNNKRRLQEIDRALKQQTEIVTRRYNEQVEAARKAASAQIAIENQKLYVLNQQLNAEIQQINSANAARQTLNTNYWNAQLATDAAGANAGLSIVSQFWNGVLSTLSGGGGIQHSSTPIIPNVVPYDGSSGGTADYSGLTVMQSPTNTNRIAGSTSAGNTAGGGGITINVPISGAGMTKRQLLREVDQRLNTTLTRAGYE